MKRALFAVALTACGANSAGRAEPPVVVIATPSAPAREPAVASPPRPIELPIGVVPPDAARLPSGLAFKVTKAGSGKAHPSEYDDVTVRYSGFTSDGEEFDTTERTTTREPVTLGVSNVIPGWTEALQLMVQGEERRVWVPAELAYGTKSRSGAPSGDLVFDIELCDIVVKPKPPPTPTDVAAAPRSAKKTKSGLAYRVLTKGTGKKHPTATSQVTVHYTGWTPAGTMFDSSIVRGEPAKFPLYGVIKGWTEGLQLMVDGEKTRFWIPAALAYGDAPARKGAPAGMLVFDIELLSFETNP